MLVTQKPRCRPPQHIHHLKDYEKGFVLVIILLHRVAVAQQYMHKPKTGYNTTDTPFLNTRRPRQTAL